MRRHGAESATGAIFMSASKPRVRTREAQYQPIADDVRSTGEERLGIQSSHSWRNDPKHLLFHLSRHKFVAKMFAGRRHVRRCARHQNRETSRAVPDGNRFRSLLDEDAKTRLAPPWTFELQHHVVAVLEVVTLSTGSAPRTG